MDAGFLYRVEDHDSRAQYRPERGIFAEDQETQIDYRRWNEDSSAALVSHFDWSSEDPSPFISTYSDEGRAYAEAKRRVGQGKHGVGVFKLDMWKSSKRVEYRNVRRLADRYNIWIPHYAWRNSEFEYVVLHHIPESAVLDWQSLN